MIRVVIDTNVLVSSMISISGKEAAVLKAIEAGAIYPCFSRQMLEEYSVVLTRSKFAFPQGEVIRTLAILVRHGIGFITRQSTYRSPDPTDTKFIDCAVASGADYLVTGNRRHFPNPFYGQAQVLNAAALLLRLTPVLP